MWTSHSPPPPSISQNNLYFAPLLHSLQWGFCFADVWGSEWEFSGASVRRVGPDCRRQLGGGWNAPYHLRGKAPRAPLCSTYSATSNAIIKANPNTMLMTPADSSGSTACGIIYCAVTQTMHPAAALISQGRAALTQPATARASSPPSGSTSPEAAPARKALPRL